MKEITLRKKRRPVKFGKAWSILFVPLLPLIGIAAVISIPYSKWWRYRSRRQEQKFEETMRSRGRTLLWDELEIKRREQNGCLVVEWLSFKGPARWWWLDADVGAVISSAGLRKINEDDSAPNLDPANLYVPLDKVLWKTRYTGPDGKAVFICGTQQQKKTVMKGRFRFEEGVNALLVAPFLGEADSDA